MIHAWIETVREGATPVVLMEEREGELRFDSIIFGVDELDDVIEQLIQLREDVEEG